MNTATASVRDFPASSAAGDDKAKGMTIWGTAWRVTAWIALAAAIAAAVAFGIHFGLAYLPEIHWLSIAQKALNRAFYDVLGDLHITATQGE